MDELDIRFLKKKQELQRISPEAIAVHERVVREWDEKIAKIPEKVWLRGGHYYNFYRRKK